jgi:hypothetical protein
MRTNLPSNNPTLRPANDPDWNLGTQRIANLRAIPLIREHDAFLPQCYVMQYA